MMGWSISLSAVTAFEIKWDGVRCLAFIERGQVRLQSRHLLDMTAQFPEVTELRELPNGTVPDFLYCHRDGRQLWKEFSFADRPV